MRRTTSSKSRVSSRIALSIRDKSCPICLRFINDHHKLAVLSVCMHSYCIDCIRKWSKLKRTCPLCKTEFHSWFFKFRFSTGNFEEERLPKLNEAQNNHTGVYRSDRVHVPVQRVLNRIRNNARNSSSSRRSRPLPLRRAFGDARFDSYDDRRRYEVEVIEGSVHQWRASIYDQRLQAIPLPSTSSREQVILGNNDIKERKQRLLEPWIRRELQAILGDSDPSVIVHLAMSLYISSLEQKIKNPSERLASAEEEDMLLQPLRPFLHDRTKMFWHELRCYDQSSLRMEVYDTVVEYRT